MVVQSLPQLGSFMSGVMSFSGGGVPLRVTVPEISPATVACRLVNSPATIINALVFFIYLDSSFLKVQRKVLVALARRKGFRRRFQRLMLFITRAMARAVWAASAPRLWCL